MARVGARFRSIRPGEGSPEGILDGLDGLLLTGGGDVDPELYGAPLGSAKLVDRHRDDFEIVLIRSALGRDLPILAVCRGIQILNVAHGGSLQDLRSKPKANRLHGIDLDSLRAHEVTILPATHLADALGPGQHHVNSFHGQAVERRDRRFVVGMQWHPEIQQFDHPEALRVFAALVAASRARLASLGRPTPP